MIEDYLINVHLEFPVYEAIPKNYFYSRKPKDLLKMFVKSANSYKNTPPCPSQPNMTHPILKDMRREEIIHCATLRHKLMGTNIKR